MASKKAPITTHVLDQTTGKPAAWIGVTLTSIEAQHVVFQGRTDDDGRVTSWINPAKSGDGAAAEIEELITKSESHAWTLTFDTQSYFKEKAFYTKVTLQFNTSAADPKMHWHVPLLLGPFGYTTYRGS